MTGSGLQKERRNELLADRAVQRLTPQESAELGADGADLDDSYDQAAAAFELAMQSMQSGKAEQAPAELLQRIENDATQFFAPENPSVTKPTTVGRVADAEASASAFSLRAWSGWVVAAAAAVALLVVSNPSGEQEADPPSEPTLAEQRTLLMESASDLVQKEWTATEDPSAENASGDVVWSDTLQSGFMRFRGLAANDPSREQYQLWIFDSQRDDAHPVDGGVFDIPSDVDEVLIPINAKLSVADAAMFAITVEQPGGVVVSSRERLPLLAQL